MNVSRKLLENYLDLSSLSDEVISNRLTFAGIEVEGYQKLSSATGLVIGEVKKAEKMIESDHLSVCLVDLGQKYGPKQIVCGAPNVAAGQKVIVATVGAKLPGITISETKIKGYESSGMICALTELGVAEDYLETDVNGIHVLPSDALVGNEEVLKYLGLDDTIFEIRPFANRSDMLAVYNIVKELSALFALPYRLPTYDVKRDFETKIKLEVKTPLVQSFTLTEVNNVAVQDSPAWLKEVLVKHGFRAINNIVDVGNYVMLLTGRPLHMYDLDAVNDERFIVSADSTQTFTALDETTYTLEHGDQVICDAHEVLCLGGIIGAKNSSVTSKTKRIAMEVAHFSAAEIRQSVTRLNLPSEASSRFSKGVNPHEPEVAINLALHLLQDLIGGLVVSNTVTYLAPLTEKPSFKFDGDRINRLLGTKFSDETMKSTLSRLGFVISDQNDVIGPVHRQDIDGPNDLAEEVIRLLGFEHVESSLPNLVTTIGEYDHTQKVRYDVRKLLRSRGLYEVLTYTLTTAESVETFKYLNDDKALALNHPMTPLRSHLRLHVLPSLLETLNYNVSRQASNLALFEISNVTGASKTGEHLAFAFYGQEHLQGALKVRDYDFYDGKGLVEEVLKFLNINLNRVKLDPLVSEADDFHPAQSVSVKIDNKLVGVFGKLHPTRQKSLGLKGTTIAGELDFKALLAVKTSQSKAVIPPRFPFVTRDLALVLNKDVAVANLLNVVKRAGGKLVSNVEVFDIYTKLDADPDKKSVALTVTIFDANKTLVDEEIKDVMSKIINEVQTKLQAEVRNS